MEDNERIAILETKVEKIEHETTRINAYDTSITVLNTSMIEVKQAIDKLTDKFENLSQQPNKEKSEVIKWIGGIVAGILIAVIVSKLTGK